MSGNLSLEEAKFHVETVACIASCSGSQCHALFSLK